ncbi:MAG: acetyltransferase [Mariprofundales bacterium]
MQDVILWGGTGQAKVIYEALNVSMFNVVAIVDNKKLNSSPIKNIPLLYGMQELLIWLKHNETSSPVHFVVAIGGSRGSDRLKITCDLKKQGLLPLSVIHQRSFIAKTSIIGEAVQVLGMAAVCANANLGNGVIINTSASVDHDCLIADGVHIAPGARLAGEVVVDECAFIGTGAIILPRIHIGQYAVIGAGAVVIKDVPSGYTMVGNPARHLVNSEVVKII